MTENNPVSVSSETIFEERREELDDSNSVSTFAMVPLKKERKERDDIHYHKIDTITLRKLLADNDLSETPIEDESLPTVQERDAAFFGPVIYFTADFIAENWPGILTIIAIIQTYAKDRGASTARLGIEYETPEGGSLSISFEGDPNDLPEILEPIRSDYDKPEPDESDMEAARDIDE
jgi:hypothetical protein